MIAHSLIFRSSKVNEKKTRRNLTVCQRDFQDDRFSFYGGGGLRSTRVNEGGGGGGGG